MHSFPLKANVSTSTVPASESMLQAAKEQVATYGYALIERCRPDLDSVTIARALGGPRIPWDGGLVQTLTPRINAPPNTYSGIYGLSSFPYHTDLAHWRRPPRYLLLRCLKGFHDVPTLLVDGHSILNAVTTDLLTRAIVKPRRPQHGAIPLMRLCEQVEDGHRFRWDEVFLKPASRTGHVGHEKVSKFLSDVTPRLISLSSQGDTLLLDNWRMLHARSPVAAGCQGRMIERIYLEDLH